MTKNLSLFRLKAVALGSTGILAVTLAGYSMSAASAAPSQVSAVSGSSSTSMPSATRSAQVKIISLAFMPTKLRIKAGTRVTWRNDEPITHTVTSGTFTGVDPVTGLRTGQRPDGRFNARLKGQGDTFSYTFKKPGTYRYYCDIHYGMNATVIVTP